MSSHNWAGGGNGGGYLHSIDTFEQLEKRVSKLEKSSGDYIEEIDGLEYENGTPTMDEQRQVRAKLNEVIRRLNKLL